MILASPKRRLCAWMMLGVGVVLTLTLSGCANFYLRQMGARGKHVPLRQFSSLYYKTSPDLTKAYVFYELPGKIATGSSAGCGPGDGFRSITIGFGAVRDTTSNREIFGEGIHSDVRVDGEWMSEFDLPKGDPDRPHEDQVKVYYGFERRDRDEPIPYKGVWEGDTTKQP